MDFYRIKLDLRARLERLKYIGVNPIDNLYLATVQKSGSQWVSEIFNDRRIKKVTGLVRMPQRLYEYGEHVNKFPCGFYVPGLYVSYQIFEYFIEKPPVYKVVYIYRDPRDIVVSEYYSILKTHADNTAIAVLREKLKRMSKADAISYFIKFNDKFSVMRSWLELGMENPNILFIKFEDITSNPLSNFELIFKHCGFKMSSSDLGSILSDYSKDKMRAKDLINRKDKTESHYRFIASSYKDEFKEEHHQLFRDVTGNLLTILGYE